MFRLSLLMIFAVILVVAPLSMAQDSSRLHRAQFEDGDKDYLHMDAVQAQLGDATGSRTELPTRTQNDYLQMDLVESQLDPELKSKAAFSAGPSSDANVFSRLVVPDREFIGNKKNKKSAKHSLRSPASKSLPK